MVRDIWKSWREKIGLDMIIFNFISVQNSKKRTVFLVGRLI